MGDKEIRETLERVRSLADKIEDTIAECHINLDAEQRMKAGLDRMYPSGAVFVLERVDGFLKECGMERRKKPRRAGGTPADLYINLQRLLSLIDDIYGEVMGLTGEPDYNGVSLAFNAIILSNYVRCGFWSMHNMLKKMEWDTGLSDENKEEEDDD